MPRRQKSWLWMRLSQLAFTVFQFLDRGDDKSLECQVSAAKRILDSRKLFVLRSGT